MLKPREKSTTEKNNRQVGTVVTRLPNSVIAEQFRTVRTNIQFSMVAKSIKSFIVTSAKSGSGKTTIAANLAAVLVTKDTRVLLVDADLRRPSVHKVFGLKNNKGLSNLLTDEQSNVSDYTSFDYASSLYIMTSGIIPHNPAELLASTRMTEVVEEMKSTFDFIVFDMPPVLPVSDVQILSTKVDGVIFVVPYGEVTKEEASKSKASLEKVDANVIGAVINRTVPKSQNELYY